MAFSTCPHCNCLNCLGGCLAQSSSIAKAIVNHATKPLVSPDQEKRIRSFRMALTLMEDAYGLKLAGDSDGSCDILIIDRTRTLPRGYYYDARIDGDTGVLDLAEWVLDEETGATRQ